AGHRDVESAPSFPAGIPILVITVADLESVLGSDLHDPVAQRLDLLATGSSPDTGEREPIQPQIEVGPGVRAQLVQSAHRFGFVHARPDQRCRTHQNILPADIFRAIAWNTVRRRDDSAISLRSPRSTSPV